jgi:hypothetical protein
MAVSAFDFSGAPATPQSYNSGSFLAGFDVTIDGAENGDQVMTGAAAHHGPDCSPPMATHTVSRFEDAVFQCRDHFMTVGEGGDGKYTIVSLTPPQMLDFSAGEATLSFDMSTWRASDRDWVEIWLTPWEDVLSEPHEDFLPAANGEPRRAIMVKMENRGLGTGFTAAVVRDHSAESLSCSECGAYDEWLTPAADVRSRFEIKVTRTHLSFCMPAHGKCFINTSFANLGWDRAVVQIQHSTYNPTKGACVQACGVNTWHWDNVNLSPSVPFYIDRASPRAGTSFTLHQPSPQGSILKFAGLGNWEYSLDGGQSWASVGRAAMEMNRPEHAQSYRQAIPAGVTNVLLRGSPDRWGGVVARDVHVWALSGELPPSTPTSTPTTPPVSPTFTPTATPTAVPPTSTPTPVVTQPTSTATPTNTPSVATSTPTQTSTPTRTPTPIPTATPCFRPLPGLPCLP